VRYVHPRGGAEVPVQRVLEGPGLDLLFEHHRQQARTAIYRLVNAHPMSPRRLRRFSLGRRLLQSLNVEVQMQMTQAVACGVTRATKSIAR